MEELHCPHAHPYFTDPPRRCNAMIKIEGFGTVECTRCYRPIPFDFQQEGTDSTASIEPLSPEYHHIPRHVSNTG